jgi:4-amino-4-deoxy-L-arabinose transferase-like glycosyltransferase
MTTDQWPVLRLDEHSKKTYACIALLALVLLGLGLRLYHIGNHGLFVDEIYSVLVAKGIGDPELIRFDSARPFYFLLLKGWLSVSSDETWMRLFSVVFGTANIILIYLLGKVLAGRKVGLAAALLTALSPMEIHYSQQVRMYTLGTFLALSGSLAVFKAFATEKKPYVLIWTALRGMMVLTLPLTGVLLAVDGLYAYSRRKETKLLPLMSGCTLALLLSWSPFICILLQARDSPYDSWRRTLDVPTIVDFLTLLVNFTASAVPLQESGGPPCFDWFTTAYVLIFTPVLGLAIAFAHKQEKMIWCLALLQCFGAPVYYALHHVYGTLCINHSRLRMGRGLDTLAARRLCRRGDLSAGHDFFFVLLLQSPGARGLAAGSRISIRPRTARRSNCNLELSLKASL